MKTEEVCDDLRVMVTTLDTLMKEHPQKLEYQVMAINTTGHLCLATILQNIEKKLDDLQSVG